ncbi:MAG: DUF1569 domain-containing protein [Bacteroidetes bacterium]|nr:DUF1569 domain-containing protein [Bacteroidota bacterium]
MTIEQRDEFVNRILAVRADDKAKFGQMNISQMVCHCSDQFRMMFGEIEGLKRQNVDLVKLQEMLGRNETVPTVEGLDQIAGGGTKPTEVGKDKETLIEHLNRFLETDENYIFSFHPYLGEIDKIRWERLVVHHLNHHLNQFGR